MAFPLVVRRTAGGHIKNIEETALGGLATTRDGIRPAKLAEAIALHIETLILEGSLRPGQRLLAERDLARALDVSRPSLREALDILAAKGLLIGQRGGTVVAEPLGEDFSQPLATLLTEHPEATDDYLEFRGFVEGAAAYLAALRASDVDREGIDRKFAVMEEAHANPTPEAEADVDAGLHLAIYEATHNVVILHVMGSLAGLLRRDVFYNRGKLYQRPGVRELLFGQHRTIHDTILRGDCEAARTAAHDHVQFVRDALREIARAESELERSLRRLTGGAEVPPEAAPPDAVRLRAPACSGQSAVPLTGLLQAHPATAFDYLEFRMIVGSIVAGLAAQRATDEDRTALKRAFAAMQAAHQKGDPNNETEADTAFHLAVYAASHNPVMEHVMGRVFLLLGSNAFYDRGQAHRREGVRDLLLRQHKAILDAVVAGDAAAARQASENHIHYAREALQEIRVAEHRLSVATRRVGRDSLAQDPAADLAPIDQEPPGRTARRR